MLLADMERRQARALAKSTRGEVRENQLIHWENAVRLHPRDAGLHQSAAQAFLDGVGGDVVLDCSALEYLSSAGLGVLLKTQKRLKATAGQLRLTGVNRHVHDIFRYAGFDQIFDIAAAP